MYRKLLLAAILSLAAPASGRSIDFDTAVMPVLTRAGCNSGQCHGAAAGRGGFRLSLLGSDAAADYDAVVRQLEGRRVNLSDPEKSLLLWKATESISHGGGSRFDVGSESYERLLGWLREGAARHVTRSLTQLKVQPTLAVIAPQEPVDLRVMATFSDGSREDVTRWTVFTAADPTAIEFDQAAHRATSRRRGQTVVIARYLDRVVPIQLIVPLTDQDVDHTEAPRHNFIDDEVYAALQTLRLPASPAADDTTFLRRVHLDLTGDLPTPKELAEYLADERPHKREAIVDGLLNSDEFARYWSYKLGRLLRVGTVQQPDDPGSRVFYEWIREELSGRPRLDEFAAELLLAEGDSYQYGPANFYRVVPDARGQAEYVAEAFLGVRLGCANCHDHPLDQWTQDDYHGLAAIFAGVRRGQIITVGAGEVTHPRSGEAATPKLPAGRFLDDKEDRRGAFAQWLTSKDNPYFARSLANRLWQSMMGRGLVEPVDDMSLTNPATHPVLLDRLAEDLAESGYDIRRTLRLIANSAAYGRSGVPLAENAADDRFYAYAYARPLEPEVLLDAVTIVTDVYDADADIAARLRAVERIASASRPVPPGCTREADCAATLGGLAGKLELLNGAYLNAKLAAETGRLQRWLRQGLSNEEIVDRFYRLSLARGPGPDEQKMWSAALASDDPKQREQMLEDFVWSLLSSREFTTNH